MPGRKRQIAFIFAADMLEQPKARTWMDDVVLLRHHVQQWTGYATEVDHFIRYSKVAIFEGIALENKLVHLAVNLARQRHITPHPMLEQLEHLRIAFTRTVTIAANIFIQRVVNRSHQVETPIDHPRRAIAVNPSHQFDRVITDKIDEIVKRQVAYAHVERHGKRNQIFDVIRMQRGVEQRQQRTQTVTHQIDLLDSFADLQHAYRVSDIAVDISVESAPRILARRWEPISEVDFKALLDQALNDAFAGLQIKDEWPLDQGIDDEQGRLMAALKWL